VLTNFGVPDFLGPILALGLLLAAEQPADAQVGAVLAEVEAEAADTYGLVVEDLRTGSRSALNEDRVFASGSVYKLALAWQVLRQVDSGVFALDDGLLIGGGDAAEVEPRGGFGAGDTPTVRQALRAMLSVSSNSAAHAFLRLMGRPSFNAAMHSLGLSSTRVPEVAADDPGWDASEATTSAGDVARLLRLLATGDGLSETSQNELLAALAVGGWPDALRDALPSDVLILDKTGNLDRASNVGALLVSERSTVVMVVLDDGVDPGEARAVIAQLGQAVYSAYLRAEE
jgi:beta-lactamase class A